MNELGSDYWKKWQRSEREKAELLEVAKAWERWEADMILEAGPGLPEYCSSELFERLLVLQVQRNEAIAKAEATEEEEK